MRNISNHIHFNKIGEKNLTQSLTIQSIELKSNLKIDKYFEFDILFNFWNYSKNIRYFRNEPKVYTKVWLYFRHYF